MVDNIDGNGVILRASCEGVEKVSERRQLNGFRPFVTKVGISPRSRETI
jgi:hypothetical protein